MTFIDAMQTKRNFDSSVDNRIREMDDCISCLKKSKKIIEYLEANSARRSELFASLALERKIDESILFYESLRAKQLGLQCNYAKHYAIAAYSSEAPSKIVMESRERLMAFSGAFRLLDEYYNTSKPDPKAIEDEVAALCESFVRRRPGDRFFTVTLDSIEES